MKIKQVISENKPTMTGVPDRGEPREYTNVRILGTYGTKPGGTRTATGGRVSKTDQGIRHTADANNPNQPHAEVAETEISKTVKSPEELRVGDRVMSRGHGTRVEITGFSGPEALVKMLDGTHRSLRVPTSDLYQPAKASSFREGVAEGHADQQRQIIKKAGKPVGEVGIDRESSPGGGMYYMKHYASGLDLGGYDSREEAMDELRYAIKQSVSEGLSWSSLDEGLSIQDKMTIFEEYAVKGNLSESVSQDKKDYFMSLSKMSDSPIKNKKYIVVPLSVISNKIMVLDKPEVMKFIEKNHDSLVFDRRGTKKAYPSKTIREQAVYNTFTFATEAAYDKFRTAVSLKFDTNLPAYQIKANKDVAEGLVDDASNNVQQDVAEDTKKDACYRKVKSRYKVWPSAYASGALVKCRQVGAANWGNKSKKK